MGNSYSTARRDIEEQRKQYQVRKSAKATAAKVAIEKAQTGEDVINFAATWRPEDAEGDRTYHAIEESAYILPNDEREQDRLELQSTILAMAFGHFAVSPAARALIKTPNVKVLDIGCANGAWMDSLFTYEGGLDCEYHGVDISEDTHTWMPVSGAKFKKANVLERLPYDDNEFDYVHMRLLIGGIPKSKWVQAIQELLRVTKPGGCIELCEMDGLSLNDGPASKAINDPAVAATVNRGLDLYIGSHLKGYVTTAGEGTVIDIESKTVSVPLGWNGKIGEMALRNGAQVFVAMGGWMCRVLGVQKEEWDAMVGKAAKEWPETKAYVNYTAWRSEDAEGDRTYHAIKDNTYLLPNDKREQDRLDLQNNIFAMAFGHFAVSPAARAFIKTPNVKNISEDTHTWRPVSGAKFKKANVLERLPYYITAAGEGKLTNFESKTVSIPLGGMVELYGKLMSKDAEEVYRTMGGFMTKVLGIEQQEWFAMVDRAVEEWPQTEAFQNFTAVWSQKARM
ncbi:hypothetical protein HDU98_008870 [Podochytrium sp. JEL0797]|nr:hypothetical protein HDU98_008870 [Podochytrium sp. JEL0797]